MFLGKGNIVIGFLRSKLYTQMIQEALWALPQGLSQTLILYLSVIIPVYIHLAKEVVLQKPCSWMFRLSSRAFIVWRELLQCQHSDIYMDGHDGLVMYFLLVMTKCGLQT